jgi:UDPglucose 6-dehydrogenase
MNIAIIGTGYVGLVTGACLAEIGHTVTCVDNDEIKLGKILTGIMPIYEAGLKELVNKNIGKNLWFISDLTLAVKDADIIFIAVGTPPDKTGQADLSYVFQVAKDIGKALNGKKVIVTKSTVPVGTNDTIEKIIRAHTIHSFDVASNPEFLREGIAISDFLEPDRVVIGAETNDVFEIMAEVYRPIDCPIVYMNRRSAELAKYGANAFLSAKITFINEMANLCEAAGGNVEDVALAIGLDSRIGGKFLKAGPGFGGSCFPKDIDALVKTARDFNTPMKMIETVIDVNEARKRQMGQKIADAFDGDLVGKVIGILGLTFKPETDDMRSAPSLTIIPELQRRGAVIKAYDPQGMANAKELLFHVDFMSSKEECIQDCDIVVLLTEWEEFRSLPGMAPRTVVCDLRNMHNPEDMADFKYVSVGR